MSHRAPESAPLAQHGAGWGGGRGQSESQTGEGRGFGSWNQHFSSFGLQLCLYSWKFISHFLNPFPPP